jgi:hypothetical protein
MRCRSTRFVDKSLVRHLERGSKCSRNVAAPCVGENVGGIGQFDAKSGPGDDDKDPVQAKQPDRGIYDQSNWTCHLATLDATRNDNS